MDPRTTPANGRVAAAALQGQVAADAFVIGTPAEVCLPVSDLRREPVGKRDRQLLMGDRVTVYEARHGFAFVQALKDGYVGYLPEAALRPQRTVTHWVAAPAGHAYAEPDIKSAELHPIYFGTRLEIVAHMPKFYETSDGSYVPKPFLRPMDQRFADPVTVAQLFYGAPYLWGGNTALGLDCSGLVQAAYLACGHVCPGDSDQQEAALGRPIDPEMPMLRGDLCYWQGHVALAVDGETLIHANAFHMQVAYEPAARAIARIEAQGDGPITSRRRLTPPPE